MMSSIPSYRNRSKTNSRCRIFGDNLFRFGERGKGTPTMASTKTNTVNKFVWISILMTYLLTGIGVASEANAADVANTPVPLISSITKVEPLRQDSLTLPKKTQEEISQVCSQFQPKILVGYYPMDGSKAGDYVQAEKNIKTPEDCARQCCFNSTECNVAFMVNATCYLLTCYNSESCAPTPVKPNWEQSYNASMISIRVPKPKTKPLTMSPSSSSGSNNRLTNITCEIGIGNNCKANQECVQVITKNRNGVCQCVQGYSLSSKGESDICEPVSASASTREENAEEATTGNPETSSPKSAPADVTRTLAVSVVSKNVTLPNNEVSLFAYAVPEAAPDQPYSYKWSLISHPSEDSAMMEGQATQQLHLMGLKQGTYMFEVSVKSPEANGSANATIDVFAEKRLNHAPVAVISPVSQTIHLPTKSAVLDASLSTDDDKIISYLWELQKGPVEYVFNPTKASNSTTLQVENLTPGNYTFKLTVEDSEHTKNFTTANITVIKETDYPPTANAGKDIVIYLPQTEVILNGNSSTDDKKIVEWEWKATGDLNKAVDMQDTHTPYLKLSDLQVGLYQFELKVTDEAGQSATSTVHVIVKPPTGNPPKANAGAEQTIVLPQNWAILDASGSTSDSNKIVKYTWSQLAGPSNTTINSPLSSSEPGKANVTGLTKGEYQFQVEIEDEAKLTNKSSVKITVMQRVNEPPKAHAGEDITVTLPCTVVKLNGSASTDDVKIAEWKWERQPESLAAGLILSPSDSSPVLQITNLVAGKYVFKLTVKDEQGLSDEDVVTLTVKEDVHKRDLIEVILDVPIYSLTSSDRDKVIQQMTLLLHNTKLILSKMRSQIHTENAVLILFGQNEKEAVLNGSELATQLRQKIHQDDGLLQFPIVSVDTVLCLDHCSGHGVCQDSPSGRECLCNAFWMENFLKRKYGNGERNCDWSKIYVGVVTCLLLMMVLALFWSLVFIFQRNFRNLKGNLNGALGSSPPGRESSGKRHQHALKKQQYTLLDVDDEEEIELETKDEDDGESDDDSDSDILFETKRHSHSKHSHKNGFKKLTSGLTGSNGTGPHGHNRNGILKPPRRIKT